MAKRNYSRISAARIALSAALVGREVRGVVYPTQVKGHGTLEVHVTSDLASPNGKWMATCCGITCVYNPMLGWREVEGAYLPGTSGHMLGR